MTVKDISQALLHITEERDELRQEAGVLRAENEALRKCLGHAEHLTHALENHRDEMHNMLIRAQIRIVRLGGQVPKGAKAAPNDAGGNLWLPCDWLSQEAYRDVLGSAEILWMEKKHQKALADLDSLLGKETTSLDHRVNAKLLKSAILRHCYYRGEHTLLDKALTQINEAVEIVRSYNNTYDIQGKVQFHRGMCLFELGRFQDAKLAFRMATKTRLHEAKIDAWKALVEEALLEPDRAFVAPMQELAEPSSLASSASGDLSVSEAAEAEERINNAAEGIPP